ncbi:hypothetical protein [Ekhidna sp.]
MNLFEYFDFLYSHRLTGNQIDKGIQVVLGNFPMESPVFSVQLYHESHLLTMLYDADKTFLFLAEGTFFFCAYYNFEDDIPLGRLYFISEKDMGKMSNTALRLKDGGFDLPFLMHKEFDDLIKKDEASLRVSIYKKRQEEENKFYKGWVNGRVKSTSIDQGIYIKTKNCVICGEDVSMFASSTMANNLSGIMVGFHLCQKHFNEATLHGNFLDYLNKKFKVESRLETRKLTKDEVIFSALLTLDQELDCTVVSIKGNAITAKRRLSSFKLILRLDSLMNYGYMIFDKSGKQIARFDSADHHNVEYGPDHLHPDLSTKKVESSFTMGAPEIDHKAILIVLTFHENMTQRDASN